jgi:hypothetical protein
MFTSYNVFNTSYLAVLIVPLPSRHVSILLPDTVRDKRHDAEQLPMGRNKYPSHPP